MMVRIGLLGDSPSWRSLLQQEGVPFAVVSSPDELQAVNFTVLVLHGNLSSAWESAVQTYIRQGGALLAVADPFIRLFSRSGHRRWIRYVLPEHDSPFRGVGLTDICARGVIPNGAQWCRTDGGLPSVLIEHIGNGIVVVVPVDFGQLSLDTRKKRKPFYARGARLPAERVSTVSKGDIRKVVHHILCLLHTERGLPYSHLWYYPDGSPTIFAIRIDTDNGTESEVDDLFRIGEEKNVRMSWFLHVEAHRGWIGKFLDRKQNEFGVHCYAHHEATRADPEKALKELLNAGFEPKGFAAPYGGWSPDIARTAEELGFLYSSEFSFDYDNLPSFPTLEGRQIAVMQVPIHPVCVGSFRRCRVTEREMVRYFDRTIDWKLSADEPLFFYHHPRDGYHGVLHHMVERAKAAKVPNLLLGEYAFWWKKRNSWRVEIDRKGESLSINGEWDASATLHIVRNGHEAIVPLDRAIHLDAVPWREVAPSPELPSDIERIRRFSPRLVFESLQTSWQRKFS